MNEFDFIDWLRKQTPAKPWVPVGPGDDCAVVHDSAASPWLVTTDLLMDGVHFHLEEAGPRRVARKAMAVNLSDIAAMGGRPRWGVVSLALPQNRGAKLAQELYLGLREWTDVFEVALVGGDTNSWAGPLVISVTLVGQPGPRGPIPRRGALPGDWLLATGPFGGSITGHHLDFTPRIREALTLQEHASIHAMIDVSDGLAADASHLGKESGSGVVLNRESIPIAPAARALNDDQSPLEHALGDGEDFELVFAVAAEDGARLIRTQPVSGITLVKIGEIVKEIGVWLEHQGRREPLTAKGFVHRLD